MIDAGLNTSILGRAVKAGLVSFNIINIRDYTNEKHGHVDDTPYGGGAGMVMMCQPVFDAYNSIGSCEGKKRRVIYTSPAGKVFNQEMAVELSKADELVFLCGHYEGVDERVLELIGAEPVSIGDYVLTGGELASMVMVDAVSRMVPGVLTNEESGTEESFSRLSLDGLTKRQKEAFRKYENKQVLEYPQYTKPAEYMGLKVPEILLSGDHSKVDIWRKEQSVMRTLKNRPDLLED